MMSPREDIPNLHFKNKNVNYNRNFCGQLISAVICFQDITAHGMHAAVFQQFRRTAVMGSPGPGEPRGTGLGYAEVLTPSPPSTPVNTQHSFLADFLSD